MSLLLKKYACRTHGELEPEQFHKSDLYQRHYCKQCRRENCKKWHKRLDIRQQLWTRFRVVAHRYFPSCKTLSWKGFGKARMQELLIQKWGNAEDGIKQLKQKKYYLTWPEGAVNIDKLLLLPTPCLIRHMHPKPNVL